MSQFYSGVPYVNVVNSIKAQFVAHPEYDKAIQDSDFDSIVMKGVRFVLKHKLFYLMKLYSKWK